MAFIAKTADGTEEMHFTFRAVSNELSVINNVVNPNNVQYRDDTPFNLALGNVWYAKRLLYRVKSFLKCKRIVD